MLIFLLSSLVLINAFAPGPSFGVRRLSLSPSKPTAVFMSQQTLDRVEIGQKETLSQVASNETIANELEVSQEEMSETKKLMQKVKDAGVAGIISYALWEIGFWAISVPVCIAGYREVTG